MQEKINLPKWERKTKPAKNMAIYVQFSLLFLVFGMIAFFIGKNYDEAKIYARLVLYLSIYVMAVGVLMIAINSVRLFLHNRKEKEFKVFLKDKVIITFIGLLIAIYIFMKVLLPKLTI